MAARKLVDKPFAAPVDRSPEDFEQVLPMIGPTWLSSVVPSAACVPIRSARSAVLVVSLVVVTAELPFWEPASEAIKVAIGPIAGVIDRGGTDSTLR